MGGPLRINQKPITCWFHPWGTIWQQTNFAWVFNKMGYQGMSGRSSFIWYGSKFCLVIFLRVQLIVSIFLVLKKLNYELSRATRNKCSLPFCVKGAQKKMHAITSKVNISTISGSILKIPFCVTPYKYYEPGLFLWGTHFIVWSDNRRFNKWSDFSGSPGMLALWSFEAWWN